MLLLITSVTILVNKSLSPLKQAKAETIAIAEEKVDLIEADEFYWYNGNETYFTITGKDINSEEIIAVVKQDGGKVQKFKKKDVSSKKQVLNKLRDIEEVGHILEARIGIHNDLAIWEVSFEQKNGKIGYAMFSLTSGEWVRTIKNI